MKKVYVTSHGPIAVDPNVEVGWEDVWLRLHSGRRTLRLAPCLISRDHLLGDIALYRQLATQEPHVNELLDKVVDTRKEHQEMLGDAEGTLIAVDEFGIFRAGALTFQKRMPTKEYTSQCVYPKSQD